MSETNQSKTSIAKRLEPFVCGGASATFASIVIHPIDLAKVRMCAETQARNHLLRKFFLG
jgi:solute carrier family 25 oxoglutarate transporter 11